MGDESNFVLAQESLFQAAGVGPISTATTVISDCAGSHCKSPVIIASEFTNHIICFAADMGR
jgi:hypothetical protein